MRIEEEVTKLEQQVTIDCVIPQKFHRTIMGSKGVRVQSVTTEFDVKIKFPEKSLVNADAENVNGEGAAESDAVTEEEPLTPKPCDIIRITGIIPYHLVPL